MHAAHPKLRPVRPIGHDLCCRDVAPVPVPALPHIHMEVHAAHQVPLVLQQPHLQGMSMQTIENRATGSVETEITPSAT